MIANALLLTLAILLGLGFWLIGQLRFLVPYRHILIHEYGFPILISAAVLFVNLFAAMHTLQRKFLLKDTGRKLSHFDKQTAAGLSFPPPERAAQKERP